MTNAVSTRNFHANGKYVTDARTCHYCLQPINALTRTKDHVVPRSLNGMDIRQNIVWSCRGCNSEKASVYPTCQCSFCRKTKRMHWEKLQIRDPKKDQ